jgi:ApbE superfamily uncharacterized protein (UPF0280 family)
MNKLYQERFYRTLVTPAGLERFEVKIRESDLLVFAGRNLGALAYRALAEARGEIERHIERDGEFARTLSPHAVSESAPQVVRDMSEAASEWGVGPMASVAGAIAEYVARALLRESGSVIVENGGDIFFSLGRKATLRLYAGEESPFTDRVLFELPESPEGLAVCTSSARVGHSLSFGSADAVVAVAGSGAYTDAAATAIANRVSCPGDVARVVAEASKTGKLKGLIVAAGDQMGFWGDIKILKQES